MKYHLQVIDWDAQREAIYVSLDAGEVLIAKMNLAQVIEALAIHNIANVSRDSRIDESTNQPFPVSDTEVRDALRRQALTLMPSGTSIPGTTPTLCRGTYPNVFKKKQKQQRTQEECVMLKHQNKNLKQQLKRASLQSTESIDDQTDSAKADVDSAQEDEKNVISEQTVVPEDAADVPEGPKAVVDAAAKASEVQPDPESSSIIASNLASEEAPDDE